MKRKICERISNQELKERSEKERAARMGWKVGEDPVVRKLKGQVKGMLRDIFC